MGARGESTDERLARQLVAKHLGARVERHDDGSADKMPDGRIFCENGRTGWLEVVTDRDPRLEAQRVAVRTRGILHVTGLRWSWGVMLRPDVRLKTADRWLGPLLREVESQQGDLDEVNVAMQRADARVLYASADQTLPSGTVQLMPGGFFGSSTGELELVAWLDTFFERHGDVAAKMAAAEPVDERHALVWVTGASSSMAASATVSMNHGIYLRLPPTRPNLPAGTSHVWLAGVGSDDRCIAWFPDRGWHDVADHWTETPTGVAIIDGRRPADGRMRLPLASFRRRPAG